MDKRIFRAVCVSALCIVLAACAQGILPSALGVPVGAVISPPVSVLEKKAPEESASREVTSRNDSRAPRVFLARLNDGRKAKTMIRSVSGYQGWLYHATGWRIDPAERIDEIVTASIQDHLEGKGIRTAREPGGGIALKVEGEIRKFHVNKTGDFENSWQAHVEILLRMMPAGRKAPVRVYTLNGYAEQYNWRGAASGSQALTEALQEAVSQIPTGDILALTK